MGISTTGDAQNFIGNNMTVEGNLDLYLVDDATKPNMEVNLQIDLVVSENGRVECGRPMNIHKTMVVQEGGQVDLHAYKPLLGTIDHRINLRLLPSTKLIVEEGGFFTIKGPNPQILGDDPATCLVEVAGTMSFKESESMSYFTWDNAQLHLLD